VLLFGIPGRRRSWQSMLVVLLVFGMLGAIGCGSTSTGSNGTQPGTYTVTVTGSGGGTTANTVIAVSVQ
jgi:ABC-type glycerol-3-phosphate transport system substrate-binding protein